MSILKPHCRTCEHLMTNRDYGKLLSVKVKINGKKKTIRIRYGEMYCAKDEPFKINKNHIRWWGFSRNCPKNPYHHTCLGCGQRMCTPAEVCSGCKKNNESFGGKM